MKRYLLLIRGSFAEWNKIPEERKAAIQREFGAFAKSLTSMKDGDGCSERSFRIMSPTMTAETALVPIETKDMVTGYFIFEARDEAEAVRIAQRCPAFGCGEHVELVPTGH